MNIEPLSQSGKGTRKYVSRARQEQAEATREAIAEAARTLFVEHGWAGTRVRDIAKAAGVSEPTVFAVYGNKAGLAGALIDSIDAAADIPALIAGLEAAAGDPAAQLDVWVGFDRRLFERGYDVLVLMREAERAEPQIGAAYDEGRRRGKENQLRVFSSWPTSAFRDGVDAARASDIFAALCNVDVYRVLRHERGWTGDAIEDWWRQTLRTLILR
jgi:AcrR family transcriptional regulator